MTQARAPPRAPQTCTRLDLGRDQPNASFGDVVLMIRDRPFDATHAQEVRHPRGDGRTQRTGVDTTRADEARPLQPCRDARAVRVHGSERWSWLSSNAGEPSGRRLPASAGAELPSTARSFVILPGAVKSPTRSISRPGVDTAASERAMDGHWRVRSNGERSFSISAPVPRPAKHGGPSDGLVPDIE
jgi:hypothetical protein